MSINRELSQLASFIDVQEDNNFIGISTGGTYAVGIGTSSVIIGSTGIITATQFHGPSGSSLIDRIDLQDEGSPVGTGFTTLNFVGTGVTITEGASGIATVTFTATAIIGTSGEVEVVDNGDGTTTLALADEVGITSSLTVGTVKIESGIITATSGIVTYHGDGSGLTNINASSLSGIATDSDKLDGQEGSYYLDYANFSGIATDSDKLDGQEGSYYLDYANFSGIATELNVSGITTLGTVKISSGIATELNVSGITTLGTVKISSGIVTATSGVITYYGDGTNLTLTDSVALGGDTTGDYVASISGTANQIAVDVTSGEGTTPVISIPNNPTLPGTTVTIENDLQVNRDLNVTGNITIGGTSATLFTQTLSVADADLILGVRTDANGNDVSTDTTASHGGIAIASTEGTPLITLVNPGAGETLPATYKKIMWFEQGAFAGLGTDAWLINYGVGIGSTQVPNNVVLAAGDVHITNNDIKKVRDINATGIITASTFVKSGGHSSEFLKADGSVDSSVYITSADGGDAATLGGISSTSFLRSDEVSTKTSGALKFDDTVHARFGTNGDLRLYHSGTASFIEQTGTATGNLNIRQAVDDADVVIQCDDGSGGTTQYFRADGSTGEAMLYHYGTEKLATKSNGIDVTGHTETDTLNVSGVTTSSSFVKASNSGGFLKADGTEDTSTYLTSYTETQTLDDVVGLGSDTTQTITVGTATTGVVIRPDGSLSVSGPGISTFAGVCDFESIARFKNHINLGNDISDQLTITARINSNLIPLNDGQKDLGMATREWRNLYVDGVGFIDRVDSPWVRATDINATGISTFHDTVKISSGIATSFNVTGHTEIDTLNVSGVSTFQGNVDLGDDDRLRFGDGNDLQIYHESSSGDSVIRETGTGNLRIGGANVEITSPAGSETYASFNVNGAVELYYDNSKKFETTGAGVTVTGIATAATFYAQGGTYAAAVDSVSDAALVLEGENSIYVAENGGDFIRNLIGRVSNNIIIGQQNTSFVNGIDLKPGTNGSVKLHAGGTVDNVKLETTGYGVTIIGGINVSGIATATDFNATSDENLKTNIRTIEDPLAKVVQIRGVNFDWKESQRPALGVIAQEVEKVLPELVAHLPDGGTKTVNYNGLIGLLIETVKEQQKQINTLSERLSKLE